MINIQPLLCTAIKFHVIEETKEAVLTLHNTFRWTWIADDNFTAGYRSNLQNLLTAKCIDLSWLIDYSTFFKEVIQYYYCEFSLVFA